MSKPVFFLLNLFLFGTSFCFSQILRVGPYLQNASPNTMTVMWETSIIDESIIEWGNSTVLGNSTFGTFVTGSGMSKVHTVQLTGLIPNSRYYYRIHTTAIEGQTFDFITPPLPESEKNFNIVSMSDMQQDGAHPEVFSDIVNADLIPFVDERYGNNNDLAYNLAYVFIPGDLVTTGGNYPSWKSTFFDPAQTLFNHIPVYPVAGNHEQNSENYFRYFNLPTNGTNTNDYLEHWYYTDYSNVRLIGLETNSGYRVQEQLDWLQTTLNDACANTNIDFVFAQLHHPHKSELWIAGNTDYTGEIIDVLESFSTGCGKPSVHFFGHTHGYSRGQSRDHKHLMVNVASAGGAIDNWGEYAQQDYKEYSKSTDDYGFVLVEVEAGEKPQFLLSRVSHGSFENGIVNAEIRDTIRVMKNNIPPNEPLCLFPNQGASLRPDCIKFQGSNFSDEDGGVHGATHWQIAYDNTFESLVYDDWFQYENWYFDEDLEAGNSLIEKEITQLEENSDYYWRLRYRDRNLAWSSWSDGVSFNTTSSILSENLLLNGGAENSTSNWTEVSGSFESISSGECEGNDAYSGNSLFAVGGVCDPNAYGEGFQDVSLSAFSINIDNDSAAISFGGFLSDYSGSDIPEFKLVFFDASGNFISESQNYSSQTPNWTYVQDLIPIPIGSRTARMVLMGTRTAGTDNDSYFDDLFVRVQNGLFDCEEQSLDIGRIENTALLQVYPNPSKGMISLNADAQLTGVPYIILNTKGAEVWRGRFIDGVQNLDFSSIGKGVYFVTVPEFAVKKRFVIQ
ncbi:MAG: metallophosphoesterase [Crocinitomicaceae bacterium]|nr:metallophosphoesterase [Crocinitomicaceae bacterium]